MLWIMETNLPETPRLDNDCQKHGQVSDKPKNMLTAEEEHSEGFYSQETLDQGIVYAI